MSPSIQFAFLLAIFVGIQADDFIEGKSQYNKDGDLEISFERLPNMTGNLQSNLTATLFFEEEKLNRQIFNMDICVDFYDKNVTSRKLKKNKRNATVVLCYDGNPEETVAPKNHLSSDKSGRLYNLAKHCGGDPESKNERVKNRRGIRLNFEPDRNQGVYTIHSVIDSAIYKINISTFEKDEVRVLRQNHVPKFCLRLEMGRMPPDDDELFDQQALVQQLLDGALLEIAANNRSDNLTKLFSEIPQLVLKVDDVKEEFALRTVDLTDAKKEMRVAGQQKRIARNLYGIFENETAINKTMEQMLSKKLYSDFVKKMKTDKNYKTSSKNVLQLGLIYGGDDLHFLNFSFNGGNIFPCRTEWVDLQKFQMERDFFHDAIHEEFSPIQIAYTVGLVGWKKEGDRGFGPGYKKKGKFGPAPEDIPDLQLVLNKTEGFTDLDNRLKQKFADWDKNINETFTILDEYSIPLQLNEQKPLGLITVKQLVFICSEFTFNLPHVASFTRGSGL